MPQLAGGLATSRALECGPICVILRGLQAIFGRAAQPNAGGGSAAGAYGEPDGASSGLAETLRTPTFSVPRGNKWSLQRPSTATEAKSKGLETRGLDMTQEVDLWPRP